MAKPTASSTLNANSRVRSSLSFERRPKLLKDFLIDDNNDFRSNGRKPSSKSMVQKIPEIILKRRRSNKILAIQKASEMVTNALKHLPFPSIKPPSILPRSISRKLSGRRKEKNHYIQEDDESVTVKVKDILRWRSFRDLVEERSTSLDVPHCSLNRCTTTCPSITDSSSINTSSKNSSWCDSDFSVEDFPSWCYQTDDCVGEECVKTTRAIHMDPKRHVPMDEEYEQHTPVSVLDSPFHEDEESIVVFHRSLANIDRRKSMLRQRINEFESLANKDQSCFDGQEEDEAEEKAKELLNHLQEKILENSSCDANLENLLLFDFFKNELVNMSTIGKQKNDAECDYELVKLAYNWLSGVYEGEFEWETQGKRETYVREMEGGLNWNKFEEEQEEMALELDSIMINSLVDEILSDLLSS